MALTAAEKQKQYRERLKASMTEAESEEYRKKRAEYERLRVKKHKFFAKIQQQLDEWFAKLKTKYQERYDAEVDEKQGMVFRAPLLVPATPFFTKIAEMAQLTEDELRTWMILYHGLSVFPKVEVGTSTLWHVLTYGGKWGSGQSAVEKLLSIKAIKYQEETGYCTAAFFRGENWTNNSDEEYDAEFDFPERYIEEVNNDIDLKENKIHIGSKIRE